MKFDLKNMSRKDLEKLQSDVEKALEKLRKSDVKKVRAEMEKLAAAHGVSLEEVMDGKTAGKTRKAKGTKSTPKFANPADPSQTWTGRGRQPEWYKAELAKGAAPDSMAI